MFQICVSNQKFKEMKQDYILKTFIHATTKNIKIQNILVLLKFQNLWNLINLLIKKIMKYSFKCDFSKFDESKKIKV
jgi:hypothetical protein